MLPDAEESSERGDEVRMLRVKMNVFIRGDYDLAARGVTTRVRRAGYFRFGAHFRRRRPSARASPDAGGGNNNVLKTPPPRSDLHLN